MLVVKNRGYKRKYIYGGSGIFETISDFLRRLLGSSGGDPGGSGGSKDPALS